MQAEHFVEAYPREVNKEFHDTHADLLQSARVRSEEFGIYLHDYLSSGPIPARPLNDSLRSYWAWSIGTLPTITQGIQERTDFDDKDSVDAYWYAVNELNFHGLNIALLPMWARLSDSPESVKTIHNIYPGVGRGALTLCQIEAASRSLRFQDERHYMASMEQDYEYFNADNGNLRRVLEGVVNEYDSAVVQLEICKQNPDLVVLPGPRQFENSNRSLNSDFVMINLAENNAVGVQVKSSVDVRQFNLYDKQHVALIDAGIDLGNVRTLRTRKGSSTKKTVGWAGLISAGYISQLPTTGRSARHLTSTLDVRFLMQQKMNARRHLSDCRPELPQAVQRVGKRLLTHLSGLALSASGEL